MIIDTAEFTAITDHVDTLDEVVAGLAERGQASPARAAYRLGFTAGLRHAGVLAAPAGRHVRPRRDRRGLRLIEGGQR